METTNINIEIKSHVRFGLTYYRLYINGTLFSEGSEAFIKTKALQVLNTLNAA